MQDIPIVSIYYKNKIHTMELYYTYFSNKFDFEIIIIQLHSLNIIYFFFYIHFIHNIEYCVWNTKNKYKIESGNFVHGELLLLFIQKFIFALIFSIERFLFCKKK